MKRIIPVLLALVIGFAAGRASKPSASVPTPEPTPAPTVEAQPTPVAEATPVPTPTPVPEPDWEPGQSRLGNWGLLWRTYQRGDEVTVLGRWNEYYIVEGEEADLLVDMRFLRLESEEAPGEGNGWTHGNTPVYSSGYLFGTPIVRLPLNTDVRIIDSKADWMYIEWDGGSGYVAASQISNHFIVYTENNGAGDSGGYTGGGYVGGGGSTNDGTDVSIGNLALTERRTPTVSLLGVWCGPEYESFAPAKSKILSDETEAYLCFLRRSDELKIIEAGEDECTIFINGLSAKLARWAVHLETDAEYETWRAYTASGAVAYTEYQKINVLEAFGFNDRVWVVDEIRELGLYVVEIKGVYGYMSMNDLSATKLIAQAVGGATGGGGYVGGVPGVPSVGGGSSGGDWTPPNL